MKNRQGLRSAIAEGAVIVVSVVLALSADAWWGGREQAERTREHVEALRRDFRQMSVRTDSSLVSATRAVEAGVWLQQAMASPGLDPDSALSRLGSLFYYEAFSPSVGAYEALIASGNVERLGDAELRRELSEFFGSFEDLRVSERLLVEAQAHLIETDEFAQLVGTQRVIRPFVEGLPDAGAPPVGRWASAPVLVNGLAHVLLRQADVRDDYDFLRLRLDEIQLRLDREP